MKKLGILLSSIVLALTVSACTDPQTNTPSTTVSPPPTSSPSPAPGFTAVEISVITSYGGDDGNRQHYERAYKAYEASTGNIVRDSSSISGEDWKRQVMETFQNGEEPDVLFFFTGVDSNMFVEQNKVVSIDTIRSVYPDYASNMKDDMLPVSPVDGNAYAVPVNGYWEAMYVNKKVLEDCSLSVPDENTTWEDFLDMCQVIADNGYTPIAASLYEVPHYWFEFCVYNNGTADNHDQLPSIAKDSADSTYSKWVNGLEDLKELYTRGFFPDNTLTAKNSEIEFLMIDNKAAFMIDGSWKLGWFAENAADINNFTVTYVPGQNHRKSSDIIGGISMGYFISTKAWDDPDKRQACIDFVKAMTSDEVVATFGATAVTALKSPPSPPSDVNTLTKDASAMVSNYTAIASAAGDNLSPGARSDLFANIVNIVTGNMTASEAIDHALAIDE